MIDVYKRGNNLGLTPRKYCFLFDRLDRVFNPRHEGRGLAVAYRRENPAHRETRLQPGSYGRRKVQSIRLAHYNAGLKGSDWRTEHAKIYPGLGDDTRKTWNALVSELERSECRRVGALVRRKAPLTPEDEAIQSRALRYEATALREWIRRP